MKGDGGGLNINLTSQALPTSTPSHRWRSKRKVPLDGPIEICRIVSGINWNFLKNCLGIIVHDRYTSLLENSFLLAVSARSSTLFIEETSDPVTCLCNLNCTYVSHCRSDGSLAFLTIVYVSHNNLPEVSYSEAHGLSMIQS